MIQRICKKLTKHRWVRLWAYSEGLEPTEYHYKCLVCRGAFWSYDAPTRQKDIKRLEAWRSEPDSYKNNSPTKPSEWY